MGDHSLHFERWSGPLICLLASVLLHAGIALLPYEPGTNGTSKTAAEFEVSLVGSGGAAGGGGGGSRSKPQARRAARPLPYQQPFEQPAWTARPVISTRVRQPRQIAAAPMMAPAARPFTTAPFQSAGSADGSPGLGRGGPGGYGSGDGGGLGTPGPRVFSSSRGDMPVRQIVIPENDRVAPPRIQHVFQRARPLIESNPPVQYPEEARAQGLKGAVYLKVTVSPEGKAESVEVLLTSRSQILDEAAVAAVKDWAFEPARTEMGPVRSVISVQVSYPPN